MQAPSSSSSKLLDTIFGTTENYDHPTIHISGSSVSDRMEHVLWTTETSTRFPSFDLFDIVSIDHIISDAREEYRVRLRSDIEIEAVHHTNRPHEHQSAYTCTRHNSYTDHIQLGTPSVYCAHVFELLRRHHEQIKNSHEQINSQTTDT